MTLDEADEVDLPDDNFDGSDSGMHKEKSLKTSAKPNDSEENIEKFSFPEGEVGLWNQLLLNACSLSIKPNCYFVILGRS